MLGPPSLAIGASQADLYAPTKAVAREMYCSERFFWTQRKPLLSYVVITVFITKFYTKRHAGMRVFWCEQTASAAAVRQQ